jgi:hypothetical protein
MNNHSLIKTKVFVFLFILSFSALGSFFYTFSFHDSETKVNLSIQNKSQDYSNNIIDFSLNLPVQVDTTNGKINLFNKNEKISSSTYNMEDTEKFWVEDLYKAYNGADDDGDGKDFLNGDWDEAMYEITAEVVNITKSAYIFVDSVIVDQYKTGLAREIGQVFETKIEPADGELGTSSDIDSNGKIIILIFNFKEGSGQGTSTTGYFWPLHMYTPSSDKNSLTYYSEYKEIIQINDKVIRKSGNTEEDWAPTVAHEYFHLIHYNYNPDEDLWLEEGLAVFAEHLSGYQNGYLFYLQENSNGYFLHAFDHSLTYFSIEPSEALDYYGHAFLFVLYFYQRFGLDLIKNVIKSTEKGIDSFKSEINKLDTSLTFEEVYSDWMITNLVNDQSNETYSYSNFSFKISTDQYDRNKAFNIIPAEFTNNKIPYWGNQFFTLPKNNLNPYKLTFLPQLQEKSDNFQLSIVTFSNETWKAEKVPLVNRQSGSYTINYNKNSETKILIISSLAGLSSGYDSIKEFEIYSIYNSRYNIYLESIDYDTSFELASGKEIPSFYFSISTLDGENIPESGVKYINLTLFLWNTSNPVSGIEKNISFNTVENKWIINDSTFKNILPGQYYFTLTVKLLNDDMVQVKGLTFLLKPSNIDTTGSNNSETNSLPFNLFEYLVFSLLAIYSVRIKKRMKY